MTVRVLCARKLLLYRGLHCTTWLIGALDCITISRHVHDLANAYVFWFKTWYEVAASLGFYHKMRIISISCHVFYLNMEDLSCMRTPRVEEKESPHWNTNMFQSWN